MHLSRPPMVWLFLVVQVPDPSDMRRVPGLLRPFYRFVLGLEGGEDAAADANGIGLGAR